MFEEIESSKQGQRETITKGCENGYLGLENIYHHIPTYMICSPSSWPRSKPMETGKGFATVRSRCWIKSDAG
jgi:hypothetical protein